LTKERQSPTAYFLLKTAYSCQQITFSSVNKRNRSIYLVIMVCSVCQKKILIRDPLNAWVKT